MQVFTRLHKLQLCISHAALLTILDEAAEGHDEIVTDWQDMQEQNVICVQRPLVSIFHVGPLNITVSDCFFF